MLTLTLSAPARMILRASATVRMPPPTVSGMKTLARGAGDQVGHDFARIARSGDVEEHQFVRALRVVALGQFHRIARVAQTDEIDAFHNAAGSDIETRNDSFRQHQSSTKFFMTLQAHGTRLLGMKLHGIDVVVFEHRGIGMDVGASRGCGVIHRRIVAMGEVGEGALVQALEKL